MSGPESREFHELDVGSRDADGVRDLGIDEGTRSRIAGLRQARAQSPQIEEERLLRRGRAAAHDRPVAQDVVLDRRADPPGRIGREADLAVRLEARRRLEQADMALLDEVAHRQPEIAESGGDRDHQAHMGSGQAMQRRLILAVSPAHGEIVLFATFEIGGLHRRPYEFPPRSGCPGHVPSLSDMAARTSRFSLRRANIVPLTHYRDGRVKPVGPRRMG